MIRRDKKTAEKASSDTGKWKGKKISFISNRVIVKFKESAVDSDAAIHSCCDGICETLVDGVLRRASKSKRRAIFSFSTEEENAISLSKQLSKRDDVEYAEPDIMDSAAIIPNDTRFGDQWSLPKIEAPDAWDIETGNSSNVLIGIIDSGISLSSLGALDHPDLSDSLRYTLGTDFVDGGSPRDLNAHGTHVAGIAGAVSNNGTGIAGMNWGAKLYICRTLDAAGNGSSADFADAVEEIVDFAVDNGLKAVINYSGGGDANQTKKDACEYAHSRGMIICAATGNKNGSPVIFPAAYSENFGSVVAVGATDSDDSVSSFSNVGPEVSVVAPGRDILSTTPTYSVDPSVALNYDKFTGTSMATPLVSGLAALIWSRNPSLTNTQVAKILMDTAKPLGAGDFSNDWGHGRVNAADALKKADEGSDPDNAGELAKLLAQRWGSLPSNIREIIKLLLQQG